MTRSRYIRMGGVDRSTPYLIGTSFRETGAFYYGTLLLPLSVSLKCLVHVQTARSWVRAHSCEMDGLCCSQRSPHSRLVAHSGPVRLPHHHGGDVDYTAVHTHHPTTPTPHTAHTYHTHHTHYTPLHTTTHTTHTHHTPHRHHT